MSDTHLAYAPNTRKRKPLLTPTPVRRTRPVERDDDVPTPKGWVKGASLTDTKYEPDDISPEEIDRIYEAHLAYLRSQRGRDV